MGRKKLKSTTWYRRVVDVLLPPGVWSDRRKFLTGLVGAWVALLFGRFAQNTPNVACVPSTIYIRPLTGELVAVGEVALVRIGAGDTLSVRL